MKSLVNIYNNGNLITININNDICENIVSLQFYCVEWNIIRLRCVALCTKSEVVFWREKKYVKGWLRRYQNGK